MISILTGKDEATIIQQFNSADIAEKWQKSLRVDVGDSFRSLGSVFLIECKGTGFQWFSPPEAAGGAALYEQLERFKWYYMEDKWEFSKALNLLAGTTRVLEVGVGEGSFLSLAKEAGLDAQGVELNPKGAEAARALGFQVYERMLPELADEISDRFDAVCSFQVLEHVPDPLSFLRGMTKMLLPGGRLILSVPNDAVMRKVDPNNQNLLNQPPHHMGRWNEKVFQALEGLLPLKIKSVHREPLATYHVDWMVTDYLRGLLSPLGKTLPRLLVNRLSTFPLRLLMRVGLRKFLPGHTLLVEMEYQSS